MTTSTTFAPPQDPLVGYDKTKTYAVKTANFGDGFVQRAKDGINNITVKVSGLSWPALTSANADTIEAFFDGLGGATAFWYTLPGESAARQFTGSNPDRQDYGPYSTFKIDLQEVHDV